MANQYNMFGKLPTVPQYRPTAPTSIMGQIPQGGYNFNTLAQSADQERLAMQQRATDRQNAVIGGYDQQIQNSRAMGDEGYQRLASDYDLLTADARDTRARNMQRIDQYGNSARSDLNVKAQQQMAAASQNAIKRGLGNTTIQNSLQRGAQFDNTRQQLALEDQLLQNRISTDMNLSAAYQGTLNTRATGLNQQFNQNLNNENSLTSQRLGYIGGIQENMDGVGMVSNLYGQGLAMENDNTQKGLDRSLTVSESALDRTFKAGESQLEREARLSEANIDRSWRAGETAKERESRIAEAVAQRKWQSGETRAERESRVKESRIDRSFQAGETKKERESRIRQSEIDRQFQSSESNKSRRSEEKLASLDRTSREKISGLDRAFQANESKLARETTISQAALDRAFQGDQSLLDREAQKMEAEVDRRWKEQQAKLDRAWQGKESAAEREARKQEAELDRAWQQRQAEADWNKKIAEAQKDREQQSNESAKDREQQSREGEKDRTLTASENEMNRIAENPYTYKPTFTGGNIGGFSSNGGLYARPNARPYDGVFGGI